jgi:S-adenosylmethionine hydrolase
MTGPVVTFVSDYGLEDDFVGVCHGVIAGICPDARIIDISHGVRRHDIRGGALIMRGALPYMPVGVHIAVVDPDVGAQRRAIAIRTADDRVLVGPDNGLLIPAADACGGVIESIDIAHSRHRLEPVSATFHGRDIFSPVAAKLAAGSALGEAGDPLDPAELIRLDLPTPSQDGPDLVAHAMYIDRFGNVQLDAGHDDLRGSGLRMGHRVQIERANAAPVAAQVVRTFADAGRGELILYEDAQRRLALAVSHGDAAATLGLGEGDELRIRPD